MTLKREKNEIMAGREGPNLRNLDYSPMLNPLMEGAEIKTKKGMVKAGMTESLANTRTGELTHASVIYQLVEKDESEFVKLFEDGVKAAFALSRTAARVFQQVLAEYGKAKMSGGYADAVNLFWFDGGLSGQTVGMTERVFQTGLKELLNKGFLAPKQPNIYWVNAALFFKGDRVKFVKEYHIKRQEREPARDEGDTDIDTLTNRADEETSE